MGWQPRQNVQLEIGTGKKQGDGARRGLTLSHADLGAAVLEPHFVHQLIDYSIRASNGQQRAESLALRRGSAGRASETE
jgi:hypothetical protein